MCLSLCVCVSLCDAGDGGENPAFWYIPVRWREYLLYQVDPEHPGTTKTHKKLSERESEGASESSPQHNKNTPSKEIRCPSSCREVTWQGQRHSMVLSSQEPGQIQTHSTQPNPWRCVSHTHAHTHRRWRATLVLLGCYPYFYPCCSWDYFLTWTTSKTNRSGDVISQPGRFSAERGHAYTLILTHQHTPWRHAFLPTNSRNAHTHTHTLTQILTSRSVKAECREEMRTDNVLNHWATLLSPSRPRGERFVTGLLSPCYYAALFFPAI